MVTRTPEALSRSVALASVGAISLIVLLLMNVWLVFVANTPSGGDMGAHVLAPAFLKENLLPNLNVLGWSNSWFAGFPMFYFYFPLPSLVIVLLDVFMPYGVAFKIVTVAGIAALPFVAYYLTRSLTFGRAVSVVTAGAAGAFLVMESFTILGGNIPSTLAGEFSFSWSLSLALAYLGTLIRALDDRRLLPLAGLLLALTALSHLVTTIAIVVASLTLLVVRSGLAKTIGSWVLGFSIAAFWAVPLLARINLTADMGWIPLTGLDNVFPFEIWAVGLLGVVGAVIAWRRTPYSAPLLALTFVLPVAAYFFLPQGRVWNGRFLPFWFFGLHFLAGIAVGCGVKALVRRLPRTFSVWWVRAVIVAGTVLAAAWLGGRIVPGLITPAFRTRLVWVLIFGGLIVALTLLLPRRLLTAGAVPLAAAGIFFLTGLMAVNFIGGWSRWNYSGYEAKEGWPEYRALMQTLDRLPPGRVQWEANSDMNRYGTPMALMLTDFWSDGHPSQEGLYFESSITTPFHFLNAAEMSLRPSNPIPGLNYRTFDFDRGVEHLASYGVRYYVSFTEEAQEEARGHPDLTLITEVEPFAVFELPESPLVEVASFMPAVYEPPADLPILGILNFGGEPDDGEDVAQAPTFHQLALEWYDDVDLLDRWVVADGPEAWPRITKLDEIPSIPVVVEGEVSDVELTDERVSFTTTAVGVPHIVKVSYFPNWTAQGAEGPYRATPSLMVVVPTEENVVLTFEPTWAEWTGRALTLIGLAFLGGTALIRRRKEQQVVG